LLAVQVVVDTAVAAQVDFASRLVVLGLMDHLQ
jgi:hypothetical protein